MWGEKDETKITYLMPSLISFYWTDQLFSKYLVPELEDSNWEQSLDNPSGNSQLHATPLKEAQKNEAKWDSFKRTE